MILATVTKQKDESYHVNRWTKYEKNRPIKTHEAVLSVVPSWAQIERFKIAPPDILRLK